MQGIFISNSGDQAHSMSGNGIEAFSLYMLWDAIFFNVLVIELSYHVCSLFIMLNTTKEKNALCYLMFSLISTPPSVARKGTRVFLWLAGVCAVIWDIWGERKGRVFCDKERDHDEVWFLVRFHVSFGF